MGSDPSWIIQPSSNIKSSKITHRIPDPGHRQIGHHCGGIGGGRIQTPNAGRERGRYRGDHCNRGRSCGRGGGAVGGGQQSADALRDGTVLVADIFHYLKGKINAVTSLLNVKRKRFFQKLNIKGKDGGNKKFISLTKRTF
jgi:hypothetical protein